MTKKQITELPITPGMDRDVAFLRRQAPTLLETLINKGLAMPGIRSLKDLTEESIQALGGGMLSAVYFLRPATDSGAIIKFRLGGINAEAEAMNEWAKKGASVVPIKSLGSTVVGKNKVKIKYLIPEAILDRNGNPAQTAQDFVRTHPEKVEDIGYKLGIELAKIHLAETTRSFGEFSDSSGNKAPYKTWNSYLVSFWRSKKPLLKQLGIPKRKIEKVSDTIKQTPFSPQGVYLHGDFSMRNAVIESERPLKLKIFDPNPIIGDPSWDIAILYNNYEFSKRRGELRPKSKKAQLRYQIDKDCLMGFIKGYEKTTKKPIERFKVMLSQIVQTTFLLESEQQKALAKKRNLDKVTEVVIRKEALLEKSSFISQMSYII